MGGGAARRQRSPLSPLFCALSCALLCVLASRWREWSSVQPPAQPAPSKAVGAREAEQILWEDLSRSAGSCAGRGQSAADSSIRLDGAESCGVQPLLSVSFATADTSPQHGTLRETIRNADSDVVAIDKLDSSSNVTFIHATLAKYTSKLRGGLGIWWRSTAFELEASGGHGVGTANMMWVRLRTVDSCSCEWPASLLVIVAAEAALDTAISTYTVQSTAQIGAIVRLAPWHGPSYPLATCASGMNST